jgi:hypothetical protein
MSLWVGGKGEIRVIDLITNVPANEGVQLQFRGHAGSLEQMDGGWILRVREGEGLDGEMLVTRDGIRMGRVFVHGR